MKQSDLFDINKCTERTKGSGIRLIRHRVGANDHGISDAQVARVLEKSTTYQKVKARFGNRAVLTPIRASNVQIRHQIDQMDIRRNAVRSRGVRSQYARQEATVQTEGNAFQLGRVLDKSVVSSRIHLPCIVTTS